MSDFQESAKQIIQMEHNNVKSTNASYWGRTMLDLATLQAWPGIWTGEYRNKSSRGQGGTWTRGVRITSPHPAGYGF